MITPGFTIVPEPVMLAPLLLLKEVRPAKSKVVLALFPNSVIVPLLMKVPPSISSVLVSAILILPLESLVADVAKVRFMLSLTLIVPGLDRISAFSVMVPPPPPVFAVSMTPLLVSVPLLTVSV